MNWIYSSTNFYVLYAAFILLNNSYKKKLKNIKNFYLVKLCIEPDQQRKFLLFSFSFSFSLIPWRNAWFLDRAGKIILPNQTPNLRAGLFVWDLDKGPTSRLKDNCVTCKRCRYFLFTSYIKVYSKLLLYACKDCYI